MMSNLTQIEESKDGFTVSTIYPYRILAQTKQKEIAELCAGAIDAAIDTLTRAYPDQKPYRLILTRERPKFGVIQGGKM